MKKYFIYAVSALALAGCSSDDFLGGQPSPTKLTDNNVINFNGGSSATTRATLKEGGEAATKLGNKFFVYGTKVNSGKTEEVNDQTNQQVVYMNYLVQFNAATANTTVSNTAGWEYVGVTNEFTTAVTPNVGNKDQTIKYWDYSAPSYVFYACSAHGDDLKNGKVGIEKITDASTETNPSVYKKGYKVTLKEGANPEKLYFSDRKVLTQSKDAEHGKKDVYGGEVNFTFRNSMAKVRVAFYETIPGYKVTINNFYKTENTQNTQSTAVTDKFVADLKNTPLVMSVDGTTYKVVYYDDESGDLENQPRMIATEDGAEKNVLTLGEGLIGSNLGTDKSTPTYDQNDKAYTWFMPQTENTSNLKLKVDYTLTSEDGSNETIKVKGATAEVPAELLRWKPNYAYTYLFKISTNTNGGTGGTGDPAGLYPITFDASVVETADGNAEYITTVSEASITTFGVNGNLYVHDAKEYTAGSDIYATVVEGDALKTLVIAAQSGTTVNTKVYKITDAYASTVNEAQVAEWVANPSTITLASYLTDYSTNVFVVTSVPSGDGHDITLAAPATALKLASIPAGTYAIEYTNTTAWTGSYKKVYKVIKVVNNNNN